MKSYILLAVLIRLSNSVPNQRPNYDKYQVLRASPQNRVQYKVLVDLYNKGKYDFWVPPSKFGSADILVDPGHQKTILEYLQLNKIPFSTFIRDVGKIITEQEVVRKFKNGMNWDDYQPLETIYDWLDGLGATYPNLVTLLTIGQSTEGRDIKLLKISNGGTNKTGFWIDASIHGNEWITVATITYITNELLINSKNYSDILSVVDFYILPVVNPDGYAYTHSTDRLWRKTRSDHNSSLGCIGVDANRNFGFHWGESGSSSDKCDRKYHGPYKYSEPEVLAIKNFIDGERATVKWDMYIAFHSYSQLWLTPWGYTKELSADYLELKNLGERAVSELRKYFWTEYIVGSSANIHNYASGSCRDWAKGEGGFKFAYTVELRDKGKYGHLLPKEQIIPTSIETWAAIQVVARHYLNYSNYFQRQDL